MAYTTIDNPELYFQTKLYTGNDTDDHAITLDGNEDMSPNLVWIKSRALTHNHQIHDTVRGVTKHISSDVNNAEATEATGLKSFDSDGFTLGTWDSVNVASSGTYVAWNWKAGTSVSGNTSGSGTAKAYSGSVNTDAGFSIIKYVGNGTAGHTAPHHLGVAPKAMIIKNLQASQSWFINFPFGTGDGYLMLDRTNAGDGSNASVWSSTAPSSSVVTLGETGGVNENNHAYIMYAFAEKQGYSKFSSYTGNGNADGTFIYTGFKPAFVLFKRTSSTSNWSLFDNKRNAFNITDSYIQADTNAAEQEYSDIYVDFLSNGIKQRGTNLSLNSSGDSFIYMAFAEESFVSSTGVPATAR